MQFNNGYQLFTNQALTNLILEKHYIHITISKIDNKYKHHYKLEQDLI
jgi:hypothetical protein